MKIIIIGGGWFGNYLGYKLKGRHKVILLEENSRIMMNAATKNQNRLHLGFHYPRSNETIIQSQSGFEEFKLEFPFLTKKIFNNIYSISKYSQVSPEDYLSVMSEHNLSYSLLSKKEERALTLKNIDLAVNHALQRKIENMGRFLNDPDLIQMSLNESEGIQPIDENISNSDLQDIINQFLM